PSGPTSCAAPGARPTPPPSMRRRSPRRRTRPSGGSSGGGGTRSAPIRGRGSRYRPRVGHQARELLGRADHRERCVEDQPLLGRLLELEDRVLAASALCAAAPTPTTLIAARVVQAL